MSLTAVNRTIRILCSEVGLLSVGKTNWELLTEEELLYEAAICVFSSQMMFEVAVAAADQIKTRQLLSSEIIATLPPDYEVRLLAALSVPLTVEINGVRRFMNPRFKKRPTSLLASTLRNIHGRNSSLREILISAKSPRHARELLVDAVLGFGPKQSSLFLRRVGYCSELAILDTHILDYLKIACCINLKPGMLSRLTSYERIEEEFQRVASEFGHAIGCVDLAMWITMRVAKREGVL